MHRRRQSAKADFVWLLQRRSEFIRPIRLADPPIHPIPSTYPLVSLSTIWSMVEKISSGEWARSDSRVV